MSGKTEHLDALIATITAGSLAVEQAADRLQAAPWGQLAAPGDRQRVDEWLRVVMDVSRIVCDRPHLSSKELGAQLQDLATTVHDVTSRVSSTPSM